MQTKIVISTSGSPIARCPKASGCWRPGASVMWHASPGSSRPLAWGITFVGKPNIYCLVSKGHNPLSVKMLELFSKPLAALVGIVASQGRYIPLLSLVVQAHTWSCLPAQSVLTGQAGGLKYDGTNSLLIPGTDEGE